MVVQILYAQMRKIKNLREEFKLYTQTKTRKKKD